MNLRCADCGHHMLRPSPDRIGPKCRRKRRQRLRNSITGRTAAAARRLLGQQAPAVPGQLHIPKEYTPMSEVRLRCISPEAAAAVVAEAPRTDDADSTVRQDGQDVVIGYIDLRWPMRLAETAFTNGHAHDEDAARVIADVQ